MNEINSYSVNILKSFAESSIAIIKNNIRTLPVYKGRPANASGKTADSLAYEIISNDELVIYGAKHIFVLMFGRKPTTSGTSSGETLRDRIRLWIDDKGITPDGISEDSLAYLIARKIHREGTLLHRLGITTTTLTDAINAQRMDNLAKELLDVFAPYATSILLEDLKAE